MCIMQDKCDTSMVSVFHQMKVQIPGGVEHSRQLGAGIISLLLSSNIFTISVLPIL